MVQLTFVQRLLSQADHVLGCFRAITADLPIQCVDHADRAVGRPFHGGGEQVHLQIGVGQRR